jgi:hypothetical protein
MLKGFLPKRRPRRKPRTRGQTLVEFALTLPIVVMMFFGIIEFARIFQAWIVLQNAARTAARYAVTGLCETCPDWIHPAQRGNDTGEALSCGDEASNPADRSDLQFNAFYGQGTMCDPTDIEHQGLIADYTRLWEIEQEGQRGAPALAIDNDQGGNIADRREDWGPGAGEWPDDQGPSEMRNRYEAGWFNVTVCSARSKIHNTDDPGLRYDLRGLYDEFPDDPARLECAVQKDNPADDASDTLNNSMIGLNQEDPGGPGEAVTIVVTFNHPLITPLGLTEYVRLRATRTMINESFRSSKVLGVPPMLAKPSSTPTNTKPATATDTPTVTYTPSATHTPSATATATATGTATNPATCALLDFADPNNPLTVSGRQIQANFLNQNEAALYLSGVYLAWPTIGDMYLDRMVMNGQAHWDGSDNDGNTYAGPTTYFGSPDPTWNSAANRTVLGSLPTAWRAEFLNGPSELSDYYTNLWDFNGTTFYFTDYAGVECTLTINEDLPPDPTNTPTHTPEPVCGYYTMSSAEFLAGGVVRFQITNPSDAVTPIRIERIRLHWVKRFASMVLDSISFGGSSAWDGTEVFSTGTSYNIDAPDADGFTDVGGVGSGAAITDGWLVNPMIYPGETVSMWVDFEGTSDPLDDHGVDASDFNGTMFYYNDFCEGEVEEVEPPVTTGTITVVLVSNPDDPQSVNFSGDLGGFSLIDNGGGGNTFGPTTLENGNYDVTITIPDGWEAQNISCSDSGSSVSGNTASVDLDAGEDVVCTFTIRPIPDPGYLTVNKEVTGGSTGSDFAFWNTDAGTFYLGAGESVTFEQSPDTGLWLEESSWGMPSGWTLDNIQCSGDEYYINLGSRGVWFFVGENETLTCTFTNRPVTPGNITVTKVTDPAGANQNFTFSRSWDGNFTLNAGGTDFMAFNDLDPGDYSINEINLPDGWSVNNINCNDPSGGTTVSGTRANISLAEGETVACTYTNRQVSPGQITIIKTVSGTTTINQDFNFSSTSGDSFTLNESGTNSWSSGDLAPGSYTITETAVSGYELESITCSSSPSGSTFSTNVSNGSVTINLDENTTATCTFVNGEDSGVIGGG